MLMNLESLLTVSALLKSIPSEDALFEASKSRSQRTSKFSMGNPIGETVTAFTPSEESWSNLSLISGSNQGTEGGPLRDCQTISLRKRLSGSTLLATSSAASFISASYQHVSAMLIGRL